jgi:iron complex outermembrane receptor protein
MLGVPSKMAGMTSAWTTSNWSASFTITRAFDWLNYDGIALATAWGGGGGVIVGKELRQYWRLYPGVTRIDASFSRQLFGGFGLLVGGHNLLDAQRGEPDNVTVLPGRTLTAGLQAKF